MVSAERPMTGSRQSTTEATTRSRTISCSLQNDVSRAPYQRTGSRRRVTWSSGCELRIATTEGLPAENLEIRRDDIVDGASAVAVPIAQGRGQGGGEDRLVDLDDVLDRHQPVTVLIAAFTGVTDAVSVGVAL